MNGISFAKPMDRRTPALRPLLERLQANILHEHSRGHVAFIILAFDHRDPAAARRWVHTHVRPLVTSAASELDRADRAADSEARPAVGNVALSATGYRALDIPAACTPADFRFRDGMKASRGYLADPDIAAWEPPYQGEVDALVSLADDDPERLQTAVAAVCESAAGVATVLAIERGRVILNDHGHPIEHFGFVDGRSQPVFFTQDLEREADLGGISTWNPGAGLELVLEHDPGAGDDHSFGSYLVFRKLEQDVRGFHSRELELAEMLGLTGADVERAGALIMGRFRDGTPVCMSPRPLGGDRIPNDFDFAVDPHGGRCPFHAHIRQVNPRGDEVRKSPQRVPETRQRIAAQERSRRIVRRGIPYGTRLKHPNAEHTLDELPAGGVGLLFLCFQSDIYMQFEHIQSNWANAVDQVRREPKTGVDAVIGQMSPEEDRSDSDQQWPPEYGVEQQYVRFNVSGFVTMRGGEYFFAPSLPMLEGLA